LSAVSVRLAPKDYAQTAALLALIQGAFSSMRGVIDPPSSADRLTIGSLVEKIGNENLILAEADGALVGCAFADARAGHLYLGKIAVAPGFQNKGIGRAILVRAIELARDLRFPELRLETRIELAGNHRTFEAWGFVRIAETAHPGFTRPTSVTYSLPV
jgi:GNAT superfamily N-acetyltransferase